MQGIRDPAPIEAGPPSSALKLSPIRVLPASARCAAHYPVASFVRVDLGSQGYRYLHCPLCGAEWYLV